MVLSIFIVGTVQIAWGEVKSYRELTEKRYTESKLMKSGTQKSTYYQRVHKATNIPTLESTVKNSKVSSDDLRHSKFLAAIEKLQAKTNVQPVMEKEKAGMENAKQAAASYPTSKYFQHRKNSNPSGKIGEYKNSNSKTLEYRHTRSEQIKRDRWNAQTREQ